MNNEQSTTSNDATSDGQSTELQVGTHARDDGFSAIDDDIAILAVVAAEKEKKQLKCHPKLYAQNILSTLI